MSGLILKLLLSCSVPSPEIHLVEIFYTQSNPSQVQVVVNEKLSSQNSVQEWQGKNITLPTRSNNNYRLALTSKGWMLLETGIDNVSIYPVNCM